MLALCVNSWALLWAIIGGWIDSEVRGVYMPVSGHGGGVDIDEFWSIVTNNLVVLLSLVAGACTLGVYTFMVLTWNGYFLGIGLASLSRTTSGVSPVEAPHLVMEFTAFLLVASAAHVLVFEIVGALSARHRVRVRGVAVALAFGVLLVLAAASFEVGII